MLNLMHRGRTGSLATERISQLAMQRPLFRTAGAHASIGAAHGKPRWQARHMRSNAVTQSGRRAWVAAASKNDGKSSVSGSIFSTLTSEEDDETFFDDNNRNQTEACQVFINREDEIVPVLCCDYGFRSGTARMYQNADGTLPDNGLAIGVANFKKEFNAIRHSIRDDEFARISEANPARTIFGKIGYGIGSGAIAILAGIDKALESAGLLNKLQPEADLSIDQPEDMDSSNCDEVQARLKLLKLSNRAVWDREYAREAAGAGVETPWFVRGVYLSLCVFLDFMFENRPIQRFWFLETVARMPYFSYISVLHLYESLGWWRAGAVLRKVHFAEEWNELHHLQIMESLGGDQLWIDRFVAMHSSIVYYWILVIMYIVNPKLAYNFSELIEAHAVDTYGEFVDANPSILRELPPPVVAAQYYSSNDLYLFEEFQTSEEGARRRPKCSNLYDVFSNIRDDEGEHVKTMRACQDMTVVNELSERNMRSRKL